MKDEHQVELITQPLKRKHMSQVTTKQNLFIGSLAWATTDDSLKDFFETVGEVATARVVTDRETHRSKGFGFVEFVDEADNQIAIDKLNGKSLDGREITVAMARPKTI